MWAIQYTDTYTAECEAKEALAWLAVNHGYLAGRVIPHSPQKPGWHVQAIFEDGEIGCNGWLPDGCRRVRIPRGFLGINCDQSPTL